MSHVTAFFDLDHTLLANNSGMSFAKACYANGRISLVSMLRSVGWGLSQRMGLLGIDEAYRRAGSLFRGVQARELRDEVHAWFHRDAVHHLRPGGRLALAAHSERDEPTVLITNSTSYVAEAAAEFLGLDAFIANDILEDEHGAITGETSRPLCHGEGKLHKAERWAAERGVQLVDACFYTDSVSDLPLLERVGTPVAVHPDRRLREIAERRAWKIEHW